SQNEAAKPPSAKKSGSRAVMIVLGLIGILIFIALFLAAVYFLFLDKAVESQF
ncbi:MAG: hypothetical protein HOP17_14900, partial [Acidobacteria bacterium]|nr:hypothetical protein [Acidobacteriota bacterium]